MKIEKNETEIIGRWTFKDEKFAPDFNCTRVNSLIKNHLEKVTTDKSGWNILFRDPDDGRYWELLYLESNLQGGGPPSLINIGNRLDKYNL